MQPRQGACYWPRLNPSGAPAVSPVRFATLDFDCRSRGSPRSRSPGILQTCETGNLRRCRCQNCGSHTKVLRQFAPGLNQRSRCRPKKRRSPERRAVWSASSASQFSSDTTTHGAKLGVSRFERGACGARATCGTGPTHRGFGLQKPRLPASTFGRQVSIDEYWQSS